MLAALASGKVAGAALDVFSSEPYSGPLLELDNVVVTPHLAASTGEAQDRAGVIVAEQVVAALEGGLVTNAVNMPVVGAEERGGARPVRAARVEPRPHRDGARRRRRRGDRDHRARRARGPRHARPRRRGAQRRVPGPSRPSRQLRQRAVDRRRARHGGAGGALAHRPRLHEPPQRRGSRRRLELARRRDDVRQRRPPVARQHPRLRDRAGARAAASFSAATTTCRA